MSDKAAFRLVFITTALILILVALLSAHVFPKPEVLPGFVKFQPLFHACVNGTCAILLMISFYFIKKKQVEIHKKINLTVFFLSAIFLLSYVLYHFFKADTTFPKDDPLRPYYLFVLSSHILLAMLVFPMVLLSFYFGLKGQVQRHRKLARWTFPIWLYVCITGVVVYIMIAPHYNFQ